MFIKSPFVFRGLIFILNCLAATTCCAQTGDGPSREDANRKKESLGDPLPIGAVARLGTASLWQVGGISSYAFSPNGKHFAIISGGNELTLWELATGRLARVFHSDKRSNLFGIVFSPDGKYLATGGSPSGESDGPLRLWEVATGKCVRSWKDFPEGVFTLAFTRDSKKLVSVSRYHNAERLIFEGVVHINDISSGDCLSRFRLPDIKDPTLALSPDGKVVAAQAMTTPREKIEEPIHLWDVAGEKEIFSLKGSGFIRAFTPDGKMLVTTDEGGTCRLYDLKSEKEIQCLLPLKEEGGYRIAMSIDGKTLTLRVHLHHVAIVMET